MRSLQGEEMEWFDFADYGFSLILALTILVILSTP
jgi:hypothetical protein